LLKYLQNTEGDYFYLPHPVHVTIFRALLLSAVVFFGQRWLSHLPPPLEKLARTPMIRIASYADAL